MNGPAVLVILVGAGEASDPTTAAMDRATRAALTDPTTVEVRESRASTPSDDEALAIERSAHPVAIVELRWTAAVLRIVPPPTGHRHTPQAPEGRPGATVTTTESSEDSRS